MRIGKFIEEEESSDNPIVLIDPCPNGLYHIVYLIEDYPIENAFLLCEADSTRSFCTNGFLDEDYLRQNEQDIREAGTFNFKVVE